MNRMETALVVDDDFLMRGYVIESLQKERIAVKEACSSEEANRLLACQRFDLVFSGLKNFGVDGSLKSHEHTLQIVMAPFGSAEQAISAVKKGAYDYLMKPFSSDQVTVVLSRARELFRLRAQINQLEEQVLKTDQIGPQPEVDAQEESPSLESDTVNLQEIERQTIIRVFHETGGCRGVMAEKLGISVRTLRNKLNQYQEQALLLPS